MTTFVSNSSPQHLYTSKKDPTRTYRSFPRLIGTNAARYWRLPRHCTCTLCHDVCAFSLPHFVRTRHHTIVRRRIASCSCVCSRAAGTAGAAVGSIREAIPRAVHWCVVAPRGERSLRILRWVIWAVGALLLLLFSLLLGLQQVPHRLDLGAQRCFLGRHRRCLNVPMHVPREENI